jgi:hypothetical protein
MAQRNIDFGAYPDDGNANSIRDAFIAVQDNFTELFNQPQAGVSQLVGGAGITLYNASGVAQAQLAGNVNVSANIYKITFQAGDPANPASLGAQFLTFNGNTTATIESSNPGSIPDVILDISPGFLANFTVANLFVSNKALIGNTSVIYSNLFPTVTVIGGNTANNIPTGNIVVDHVKATPLGRFIGNVSLQDVPYSNVGGIVYNDLSPVPFLASQGIEVLTSDPDFFRYDSANFNLLVPNVTTNNITALGNINGNFTGNISGNITVLGIDRGLAVKSGNSLVTTSTVASSVSTTIANAASTGNTFVVLTSLSGVSAGQAVTSSVPGLIDPETVVVARYTSNNSVELSVGLLANANVSDPISFTSLSGYLRYTTGGALQALTTPVLAVASNLTLTSGSTLTLSNNAGNLSVLNNVATTGTSTGALRVNGGVGISQALNVGANINANSLNVGNSSPNGNLGAFTVTSTGVVTTTNSTAVSPLSPTNTGALQVAGGVSVGNNIYVGASTDSSNLSTGAARIVGGAAVGGNLNVGNVLGAYNLKIGTNAPNGSSGNFEVTQSGVVTILANNSGNAVNANYSIVTAGGIQANNDVLVRGTTVSSNTQTGALVVFGGVGIGGDLNLAGNVNITSVTNTVSISSTVDSSNSSNGAFTVAGGVGIAKKLNVGTSIATDAIYVGNNAGNSGFGDAILTLASDGNIYSTSSAAAIFPANVSNLDLGLQSTLVTIGSSNGTTILNTPTLVAPLSSTTQYVFDTTTSVVYFAGDATSLFMGNTSGTANLRNPTLVGSQTTQNVFNTIATTVNAFGAATSLNVGGTSGTATLNNPTLVGSQSTQNVYNTTATTVNAFGAATTLNLGANSGTATLRNPTIVGTETSQNLFNTTATTVNAFGAATSINMGNLNGTLTLRSSTIVGAPTQTTQTIFNTIATTVNAFGAATTINLANNADTTLNIGTTGANGAVKIYGTQNANNANYQSGALQVAGGAGFGKDVFIGGNLYLVGNSSNGTVSNTIITITNTSDSSNAIDTTASFSTAGGESVAKSLNVGANIRANYLGVGGNAGFLGSGETIILSGDLTTSNIDTTSSTFNLANSNAATINFGRAATTVNIGQDSAGSKLTIYNGNVIGANSTQSLFDGVATTVNFARAALFFTMGAASGTLTIQNPNVVGVQSTQNVYNTVATTLNFGGAATTLNMGANSGTATLRNPTLVGTETTQNVYNSTATTVNAFGAATSLIMGATTGTANIRNQTVNIPNGNLSVGGNLSVTGNTTSGNIYANSGTIGASLFSGNGSSLTNLNASNISSGTLAQARLANSSITVNGTSISLGGSATITASTTNAVTFNNGGSGDASGTTFDGSAARTISYNTVGAPSASGSGASGTWSISISGSASSATTAGTVTTASQPNITSTGSLTNTQTSSLGVGTAASGTTGEIRATNNVTAYYSDDRLKKRLGVIENALEKINTLTGFYYEANDVAQELGYKVKREVGLSAQEVERILPEVVAPAPIDEKYKTLHYERIIPLIVEALKEVTLEMKDIRNIISKLS